MIPNLVFDKIYWYVWKLKQKEICHEYKQNIMSFDNNCACACYAIKFTIIENEYHWYNYRSVYLYHSYKKYKTGIHQSYIFNIKNSRNVAYLPSNYF